MITSASSLTRSRSSAWRRAATLLLSTLAAVGLAELSVRTFVEVHDVGPSFTVWDAELGKRLKRSYSGVRVTPDFRMHLSTNSLGWRGPEPVAPLTGAMVFLGDSFTLGYGVSDGEEYPRLVGEALRRPVVNMGLGDNGQARWLRLLRSEVKGIEPSLVVLQLCGNDCRDNLAEGLATLDPAGRIQELPPPPPGLSRRLQGWVESVPGLTHSHFVCLFREVLLRPAPPVGAGSAAPVKEPGLELTMALLDVAIRLCREANWRVIVLSADLDHAQLAPFAAHLNELSVPLVHVPAKSERPDLYYPVDGHWNPAGQREAASRLLRVLGT